MKYKIIIIITVVILILINIFFSNFEFKEKRYHQHLEASVKAEDVKTIDEFATHLPIIQIETEEAIPEPYIMNEDGSTMKDEFNKSVRNYEKVRAEIKYTSNDNKEDKINDKCNFKTNAYIRTRGRSSRTFEKKGYSIDFMNDEYTKKRGISVDGMVADSDWALHGPYMDKTLIRNYFCYNLAGEFFDVFSPEVRFCELFLNGKYEGLYLIVEEIDYNDSGRINVTESNPKIKETSYILKIDELSREYEKNIESFFFDTHRRNNYDKNRVSIRYPSKNMTNEQKEYIESKYYEIERTLSSETMSDRRYGYRKYLDVDSFVDYFIFNEFVMNSDVLNMSTFIYSDIKDGKIRTAVWDFNNAFGNFVKDDATGTFIMPERWWYKYLFKDEYFTEKVIKRYKELRKKNLTEDNLYKYIDETVEYLGPVIDRNFKRWNDVMGSKMILDPEENNKYTYQDNIEYLKFKIKERLKFMDENIESLRRYSHESKNN